MEPNERVMRVMTHVNIGAALAVSAWVVWSGLQVGLSRPAPPDAAPPRIDTSDAARPQDCRCAAGVRDAAAPPSAIDAAAPPPPARRTARTT